MAPMQLLRVGDLVEALDLEGQWYPARVMQQASEGLSVLLHFDGWSDSYDEWHSGAYAPAGAYGNTYAGGVFAWDDDYEVVCPRDAARASTPDECVSPDFERGRRSAPREHAPRP